MKSILYETAHHYVTDEGAKGYAVWRNGNVVAVRVASIGRSLGMARAITEADKRESAA